MMFKKQVAFVAFCLILGASVHSLISGEAASASMRSRSGVVGSYLLTVTAPGFPPFQELLTLHRGGTVSETNTTLHPNSANPFLNFNGSDGYGAWRRGQGGTVVFRFVKLVFDGDTNQHAGYLTVDATALIRGDHFANVESDVNILLGPDLDNPFEVIPLGPTDAVGTRISVDSSAGDDDDSDSDD